MYHPVCGKCHSSSVYRELSPLGDYEIVCLTCGNRYPGGQGFYLSGKENLKDHKEVVKHSDVWEECRMNPDIEENSPAYFEYLAIRLCLRKIKEIETLRGK